MLLPCLSHERLTTSKHDKGASSRLRQGIGERAGTCERIAPAFSVAVCFIWFPWMRCYPEHPAPARNRLIVPAAAQSLPVLPVAEPQASIGSMVAESAVLVALAEQEKAVAVVQVVVALAEQVGIVRAVVAVQVAQA